MDRSKYLNNCLECDDFDACPYPDLMKVLDRLVEEKFDGDVNIYFKDGLPSRLCKQQIIELIRI